MANRLLIRTLLNQSLIPRSFTSSYFRRLCPAVAISAADFCRSPLPATDGRAFSTRLTTSSLNDSNPNWSNRPPKETILLDGCDFEHWLVVLEEPQGEPTRDQIIESYINTLAKVVGSYDESRMKIYSVSTRCYFAFGALVSEELSYKLKELPGVRWVLPDSYLDVKNKDYGGEPFIDGKAVPYDPKYHEEWIRNNARAKDSRPHKFVRPRNFERRRENMQNYGGPPNNIRPLCNMGPPNNMGPPGNMDPPNNIGPPSNMDPPNNNMGPPSNNMGPPSNMGPPNNNMGPPGNMGPPNNRGLPNNMGPPSNRGLPNNMGPPSNHGLSNMGPPSNLGPQVNRGPTNNWNGPPSQRYNGGPPNNGLNYQPQGHYGPNSYQSGPGHNSYSPNSGGENNYQTQDVPGRGMSPAANYE